MHYPGDPRTRTSRIHIGAAELAQGTPVLDASTAARRDKRIRSAFGPGPNTHQHRGIAAHLRLEPTGSTVERKSVASRELGQPIVGQVLQPNLPTCHWPVLRVDDVDQPQLLKSSAVDWRRSGPQAAVVDCA